MAVRNIRNVINTAQSPDNAYAVGYRQGYIPPWLNYGATGLGVGSFILPMIGDSIGLDPTVAAVGSALVDTTAESFGNWLQGIPTHKNLGYAGGNLAGSLGGTYLARQLTGTHDDSNGFIDSVGLFAGEATADAITDALYKDIKWSEVPEEAIKAPFSIVTGVKDLFGNLVEESKDFTIEDYLKGDVDSATSLKALGMYGRGLRHGKEDRKNSSKYRMEERRSTVDIDKEMKEYLKEAYPHLVADDINADSFENLISEQEQTKSIIDDFVKQKAASDFDEIIPYVDDINPWDLKTVPSKIDTPRILKLI